MKTFSIFLILSLVLQPFCFGATITPEQKEVLHLIHKEIQKRYPDNFYGIGCVENECEAYGISEQDFQHQLDTINLQNIKDDDPKKKKKDRVTAKLQALGFDDEMIEYLKDKN